MQTSQTHTITRKSFLAGSALAGATVSCAMAGAGLAAADEGSTQQADGAAGFTAEEWGASIAEIDPITEFADEKTYDIVVVGSGVSGVPAFLTAVEEGVSVACLQKEDIVAANGSGELGVILDESDELGLANWEMMYNVTTSYRYDHALFSFFREHSGESALWLLKKAFEVGATTGSLANRSCDFEDGSHATVVSNTFPNASFMPMLADRAVELGGELFLGTPAVQLVKDDSGRVTGVIGRDKDGNAIKFNANLAVILATGDYENNQPMVSHYAADHANFIHVQSNRTGDGILMAALAGGHIVAGPHPSQLHDMHTTPFAMQDAPFFAVKMDGTRFMNEQTPMDFWWQVLRLQNPQDPDKIGHFARVFDNDFGKLLEVWGQPTPTEEDLDPYMPESENYNGKGAIYKADTLEELAEKAGIDATNLLASVERYNELCARGTDEDYGKAAEYLMPIQTAPFWCVVADVTCCAIDGGIAVNGNYQVVDSEGNPIEGLYSVGSGAGCLCGDVSWPLEYTGPIDQYYGKRQFGGVSNGHCINAGRYATIHAITGGFDPSEPVEWNDAAHAYYFDGVNENPWA